MRSPRRVLLAALLLLAGCGAPQSPWRELPVKLGLKAQLQPETVPLLGTATLTLDLFHRRDVAVEFAPKLPDGCQGEIESQPERDLDDGIWLRTVMTLRPLRGPGPLPIGPFTAKAKDGIGDTSTEPLRMQVTSLLHDAGAAIEAPAPPIAAASRWYWWALGGVAAATLLLLFWRWQRARPQPAPRPAVELPPHVKALRALGRLHQAPRTTPAQIEAFYVEVSQVLRVYLEERFGLRAPERTTEEFLLELEQPAIAGLDLEQRLQLRRFLSQCDLVKFAAQTPGEDVHQATFAIAEGLVEATRSDRAAAAVRAG